MNYKRMYKEMIDILYHPTLKFICFNYNDYIVMGDQYHLYFAKDNDIVAHNMTNHWPHLKGLEKRIFDLVSACSFDERDMYILDDYNAFEINNKMDGRCIVNAEGEPVAYINKKYIKHLDGEILFYVQSKTSPILVFEDGHIAAVVMQFKK